MASREEIRLNAYNSAVRAGETKIASMLKENYLALRTAFPELNLADPAQVTSADYRRMATQLIDSKDDRKFEAKDASGKTITIKLDDINTKLQANGVAKISIPTREQLNAVATEVGAAAKDNTGYFTQTSIFNMAYGMFTSASIEESAAGGVKDNLTARLHKLRDGRPDLKEFLSDQAITEIGNGVYTQVTSTPATPGKDALDSVAVKDVGEIVRDQVAEKINHDVYDKVHSTIEKRVEQGKQKIRDGGDGGFMGMIMSFIFMIAEALGLENGLARLVGSPIPDKTEIDNASQLVANGVSSTVDQNAGSVSQAELVASIKTNVESNLRSNRGLIPSFTDEQITEMATEAAKGINDNYAAIPKLNAPAYAAASQVTNNAITGGLDVKNTGAPLIGGLSSGQGLSLGAGTLSFSSAPVKEIPTSSNLGAGIAIAPQTPAK